MSLIESLFTQPGIVTCEAALDQLSIDSTALLPEEQPAIARAVDKRKQEFIAGRILCRRAFAALGFPPAAVPQAADRSPIWPKGLVGSITHTTGYCAAVVGPGERFLGIGVDVETAEPLKENLWTRILTPRELSQLMTRPAAERGRWGKLVFCAKEAAYKAQHTVSRTFLGFDAMHIEEEQPGVSFRATFNQDVGKHFTAGTVLTGRFAEDKARLAAGVVLPR